MYVTAAKTATTTTTTAVIRGTADADMLASFGLWLMGGTADADDAGLVSCDSSDS